MDPNFLCPICKKDNCFVCKYWNDNELMDLLLSENGALCYEHYDSVWLELLTHFFVWNGKVETTIGELYSVFQRNGFIPYGITSFLNGLQSEGKITIRQKEEKKKWYSYLFSFFSSSTLPENTIVRCDYILKEAVTLLEETTNRYSTNVFVLNCKESLLHYLHNNQQIMDDLHTNFLPLNQFFQDIFKDIKCRPLDLPSQAKIFLCNLRKGEDYSFASYCVDQGIGSIYTHSSITLFILQNYDEVHPYVTKAILLYRLSSCEKEYDLLKENFEENKKKLVRENKNSNRSEIKNKYISMKKEFLMKEKRLLNEIKTLQDAIHNIDMGITAKEMCNAQMQSAEALRNINIPIDELNNTLDAISDFKYDLNEANNILTQNNTVEEDEEVKELEKQLDGMIVNETLPSPPTTLHHLEAEEC